MVDKFTKPPYGEKLIEKINEIIDNLGGGGVAPVWGNIAGTLSNQTDLQNALDDKYDASNPSRFITSSALAPYALSADLSTVATSGSYNDLTNKPTIPAAQVNSDWNASSGVAQILNKPTLATVATSGSYNDLSNKPTIPDTSNLANKDLSNLSSTGDSKFQAPLVSGTNIKTVNGNSLLGSGDIIIQAHFLLEPIWSDHLINDISFLRADTFSWQDGGVYPSVYNHLVQDLQGTTAETETIGSNTVTFYRATDGHKICLADQEQTVLNIYNTYGIAWYYILDSANTQFKLPRTKYGFEGLRTNVGDKIDESLPNITSKGNYLISPNNVGVHGAVNITNEVPANLQGGNSTYVKKSSLDASRSSSTYQDNAPVQERATQMYLYFYVGDYTQTAIEQTAGLNAELFNNKLDINASNLSAQGMSYMAGMGMPSNEYIDLTLGADGTLYTAPADGWFYFLGSWSNKNGYIRLENTSKSYKVQTASITISGYWGLMLPIAKGDSCLVGYATAPANVQFRFIYAVGSESEAS